MPVPETARVPEDISGRPRRMPVGGITWRHTFRAHAASQLSPLFLGPACLAHRHMDATDGDELVCVSDHEFEITAWRCRRRGIRADDVVLDLGRLAGRSLSKAFDHRRDTDRANDLRVLARSRRLGRIRDALVYHHYRCAQWRGDGLRHACAPGVHGRDDKPRRFAQCDLAQQFDCKRRARCRSINRGFDDWRGWRDDVFFLNGVTFVAVIAGLLMMRLPPLERSAHVVVARRARLERYRLLNQTSARAHDSAAISRSGRLWLVVCSANAGLCARRAWLRRKRLRPVDVGERNRRL